MCAGVGAEAAWTSAGKAAATAGAAMGVGGRQGAAGTADPPPTGTLFTPPPCFHTHLNPLSPPSPRTAFLQQHCFLLKNISLCLVGSEVPMCEKGSEGRRPGSKMWGT